MSGHCWDKPVPPRSCAGRCRHVARPGSTADRHGQEQDEETAIKAIDNRPSGIQQEGAQCDDFFSGTDGHGVNGKARSSVAKVWKQTISAMYSARLRPKLTRFSIGLPVNRLRKKLQHDDGNEHDLRNRPGDCQDQHVNQPDPCASLAHMAFDISVAARPLLRLSYRSSPLPFATPKVSPTKR